MMKSFFGWPQNVKLFHKNKDNLSSQKNKWFLTVFFCGGTRRMLKSVKKILDAPRVWVIFNWSNSNKSISVTVVFNPLSAIVSYMWSEHACGTCCQDYRPSVMTISCLRGQMMMWWWHQDDGVLQMDDRKCQDSVHTSFLFTLSLLCRCQSIAFLLFVTLICLNSLFWVKIPTDCFGKNTSDVTNCQALGHRPTPKSQRKFNNLRD